MIRKGSLPISMALLLFATTLRAETLLTFSFENADGDFDLGASTRVADILEVEWRDDSGTLREYAGNPTKALGARQWNIGNSLILDVTLAPGAVLTIDTIRFDQRASATGATNIEMFVDDRAVGTRDTTLDFEEQRFDGLQQLVAGPFQIRIAGLGGSSSSGTYRIDNFALSGSVAAAPVPLPATWLLLASSLVSLRRPLRMRRS